MENLEKVKAKQTEIENEYGMGLITFNEMANQIINLWVTIIN